MTGKKKKQWSVLVILTAVAIAMAAGFVISTERDAQGIKIDDSPKHAEDLFEAKVDDINDTAAIVELFDIMGIEKTIGEYSVEISLEGDVEVLALTVVKPVQQADKKLFDANMEKYAQQMLALISQIERVQWIYSVETTSSNEEAAVVAVDKEGFRSALGKAPEDYGDSAGNVKTLLEKQTGRSK